MTDILSNERYEPPEIEVLTVQVEVGFYGTYNPPSGGGTTSDPSTSGGATAEDWEIIYGTWD